MQTYKVHCGYTANGRNKWARFGSLDSANEFCQSVFAKTKTILTIQSDAKCFCDTLQFCGVHAEANTVTLAD